MTGLIIELFQKSDHIPQFERINRAELPVSVEEIVQDSELKYYDPEKTGLWDPKVFGLKMQEPISIYRIIGSIKYVYFKGELLNSYLKIDALTFGTALIKTIHDKDGKKEEKLYCDIAPRT